MFIKVWLGEGGARCSRRLAMAWARGPLCIPLVTIPLLLSRAFGHANELRKTLACASGGNSLHPLIRSTQRYCNFNVNCSTLDSKSGVSKSPGLPIQRQQSCPARSVAGAGANADARRQAPTGVTALAAAVESVLKSCADTRHVTLASGPAEARPSQHPRQNKQKTCVQPFESPCQSRLVAETSPKTSACAASTECAGVARCTQCGPGVLHCGPAGGTSAEEL